MLDINTKKMVKNAWRVTKTRNMTSLRIRVPGGAATAEAFKIVTEIAETYGNGEIHMTTRQGFEILGIPMEKIEEVNRKAQGIIDLFNINQTTEEGGGYTSAGTRNVAACIGNKACIKAQYNTTELAKRIEDLIFPHDFHVKIALTGCPNDCQKVRTQDFGIMGMALPLFDPKRCVSCGACTRACQKTSTGALTQVNFRPYRDHSKCNGCGECVSACPTRAFVRDPQKYYRLTIMGRTGKKNPRLGEDFLFWVDEGVILQVIKNCYAYINRYIDRSLPKEHVGYIVDRTGFKTFMEEVLEGVQIAPPGVVKTNVQWGGIRYQTPLENE